MRKRLRVSLTIAGAAALGLAGVALAQSTVPRDIYEYWRLRNKPISLWAEGQIKSTVATGTAPLTISSTTLVSNLNADSCDGYNCATLLAGAEPYVLVSNSADLTAERAAAVGSGGLTLTDGGANGALTWDCQAAGAGVAGCVTTGTQTLAGAKTFSGAGGGPVVFSATATPSADVDVRGKLANLGVTACSDLSGALCAYDDLEVLGNLAVQSILYNANAASGCSGGTAGALCAQDAQGFDFGGGVARFLYTAAAIDVRVDGDLQTGTSVVTGTSDHQGNVFDSGGNYTIADILDVTSLATFEAAAITENSATATNIAASLALDRYDGDGPGAIGLGSAADFNVENDGNLLEDTGRIASVLTGAAAASVDADLVFYLSQTDLLTEIMRLDAIDDRVEIAGGITATGTVTLTVPLAETSGGTGVSNTATSGRYLRADGSNFVTSSVAAAGAGACAARAAATTLTDNAAPTCTEFVDIASTQAAIGGAKTFLTSVAVGLTTDDATLTSNRVSTGSDQFGLTLQHTDSNTAGDTTLGIGIQFSLEDGGSVMNESGSIMSEWTVATAGAEYADLIFRVTRNGTTGVEAMRTERGSLQVHGYLELEANGPTSTGNPLANSIGLYVREDISCGGAAAADCCLRARTSGGAEVTVAVVVTDAGCP